MYYVIMYYVNECAYLSERGACVGYKDTCKGISLLYWPWDYGTSQSRK